MNDEPIISCLASSETFDDGMIAYSLYLYKKIFKGDVSYIVTQIGTRYEFGNLISVTNAFKGEFGNLTCAINKFNELNYNSLILR